MATNKKNRGSTLTIVEAVDTLSSLVNLDFEHDDAIIEEQALILPDKEIGHWQVHWLAEQDREETLDVVREVFLVVLDYLKNFYRDESVHLTKEDTIEGIKSIMVLVGEASKKLDKYTTLFYKTKSFESVTDFEEYKDLQKFYQSRISQKIDEGLMGKWILGLAKKGKEREVAELKLKARLNFTSEHLFVDLESVKKDTEYELFYLRKEDGSRFFNPRLIKNMKLASDFENYLGDKANHDPLIDLSLWQDKCAKASAIGLIKSMGTKMERFFHETTRSRRGELGGIIHAVLMALLLCAHHSNHKNHRSKSCYQYFCDFQGFLWQALHSREYQKNVLYPPRSSNKSANILVDTVHSLCRGMFVHLRGYEEMLPIMHDLVKSEATSEFLSFWEILQKEYKHMAKNMRLHPNGPLILLLNQLEEGKYKEFAPLKQGYVPMPLYSLYYQDRKVLNIRMPSPTTQEAIHKVFIDELFYGFLRACETDQIFRKHLLINFQDKTSWREIGRCQALEGLSSVAKLKNHVGVVTLAADTEFYHQLSLYRDDSDSKIFQRHFYEQIFDEGTGYFLPKHIKMALFPKFAEKLMEAIHNVFFAAKKKLTREERMNFIQIFYIFLILKLLELENPDSFSLTCKDGIDIGGSMNSVFYTLLRFFDVEELTPRDIDCLHYSLFMPALLHRERLMRPERFHRAVSVISTVEELRNELGAKTFSKIITGVFGPLFESQILHVKLVTQRAA